MGFGAGWVCLADQLIRPSLELERVPDVCVDVIEVWRIN